MTDPEVYTRLGRLEARADAQASSLKVAHRDITSVKAALSQIKSTQDAQNTTLAQISEKLEFVDTLQSMKVTMDAIWTFLRRAAYTLVAGAAAWTAYKTGNFDGLLSLLTTLGGGV